MPSYRCQEQTRWIGIGQNGSCRWRDDRWKGEPLRFTTADCYGQRVCPERAIDLGEVAIIPGLVNAHTHLEFSALTEHFHRDCRSRTGCSVVVGYRREHPTVVSQAIERGLTEALQGGTTLIGDIATSGWTRTITRCRTVWGRESSSSRNCSACLQKRIEPLQQLAEVHLRDEAEGVIARQMLSPHAPYSVHPEVLEHAVQLTAAHRGRTLAIHLAETAAERELLASASGEFRTFLESMESGRIMCLADDPTRTCWNNSENCRGDC